MKSVLLSVQPKWCELIASGNKTVEVRKTKPKIDVPFKCYIYMTKDKWYKDYKNKCHYGNGKVIGEFVCQAILNYECEFVDDDCYESIASILIDEDGDKTGFIEWSNDGDIPYKDTFFYKTSRIGYGELKKYMGVGFGTFYGWHISNLVIYDKPKELGEFYRYTDYDDSKKDKRPCYCCEYNSFDYSENCEYCSIDYDGEHCIHLQIKRPPQSWCYVERKEDEGK